jgi:hypothetical protein
LGLPYSYILTPIEEGIQSRYLDKGSYNVLLSASILTVTNKLPSHNGTRPFFLSRSDNMAFAVEAALDSDMDKIITIMFQCYGGTNEYINAVFPRGLTEDRHRLTVERLRFIASIASGVWWEEVIDRESGEVVGGAMWNLCEKEKPPAFEMDGPPGTWNSEAEKRYAQALQRSFVEDESKLWAANGLPLLGVFGPSVCKVPS